MRYLILLFFLSCNGEQPAPQQVSPVDSIGFFVGDTVNVRLGCGHSAYGIVRQMYEQRVWVDFPDSVTGGDYPRDFYQDNWYPWWDVNRKVWNQQ